MSKDKWFDYKGKLIKIQQRNLKKDFQRCDNPFCYGFANYEIRIIFGIDFREERDFWVFLCEDCKKKFKKDLKGW